MSNVHTLNDIKDREGGSYKKPGYWLGSVYEQELEKKIRSITEFNSEINDLSEKLVDKYNEREKEFENKASQLIASTTKLEAKYSAKIQSLKSKIKTLKREETLVQKASSADKVQILSLETKVRELEGGLIDELAQINSSDPKEIDSLRLELEQTIDSLFLMRSNLIEANRSLREQLALKKNNEVDHSPLPINNLKENESVQVPKELQLSALNPPPSQIFSAGGVEAVFLPSTTPIEMVEFAEKK
ncbi:hypothetical protein C1646_777309 [Rhizophagus diaphanus]|nr:hypothetical protein C1646_777309 [Rhizophagus diaphanus] [Rhizophagus sp. MUCL 43196]